ncbi:MAG TPA: thioredoxin domain-containing protein, partial [Clostridia bacterium]
VELYENTYAPEYLRKALKLCDDMIDLFWDNKNGGFFVYGNDSEKLIARPKEIYDGATPSGNSVAAYNLVRLSRLSGRHELEEKAQNLFEAFGESIGHSIFMIMALMYHISPSREVVIAGRSDSHNTHGLLGVVRDSFMPFTVSMLYTGEHGDLKDVAPFVEGMEFGNMPAAYVCENLSCMQPITEAGKLSDILAGGSEFTS